MPAALPRPTRRVWQIVGAGGRSASCYSPSYLPPLREALRLAPVARRLIVSATLALLLVAPAELGKAFVR
jgi:hypothetical protein